MSAEPLLPDDKRPRRQRGNPSWVKGHRLTPKHLLRHRTLKRRLMQLAVEAFDAPMAEMLNALARQVFAAAAPEIVAKARAGDPEAQQILLQATLEPRPKPR